MYKTNFSELSEKEKHEYFQEYNRRNTTRIQFCRDKGICPSKFDYWGGKLGYFVNKKTGFKKISPHEIHIKIELEDRVSLGLKIGSYHELKQLLETLKSNV